MGVDNSLVLRPRLMHKLVMFVKHLVDRLNSTNVYHFFSIPVKLQHKRKIHGNKISLKSVIMVTLLMIESI